MLHLHALDQQRLQRGVAHLHGLGPRATAEALAAIIDRIGGLPAVLDVLGQFSTVNRRQVVIAGGDRFPSQPIASVPEVDSARCHGGAP